MMRRRWILAIAEALITAVAAAWGCYVSAQPIAPQPPGAMPQPGLGAPQPAPQVPFVLNPQEEASLDLVLRAWQHHSSQITTYSCNFTLWEYDAKGGFVQPARSDHLKRQSEGIIKYAKPDKGLYNVQAVKFPVQSAEQSSEPGDYWVCDGRAIYTKDFGTKKVIEYRLPAELQGKAISDGPLPFVFGVEADKLRQRYWMRIITPATVRGQVWIEAYPKQHRDAQNFRKIDVILTDNDLTPTAVKIYLPNDESHRQPPLPVTNVYAFNDIKKNSMLDRLKDFFANFVAPPTPFGWQREVQDGSGGADQIAGPPQPQNAPVGPPAALGPGAPPQTGNRAPTVPPRR